MADATITRATVHFSGHVQGVGFRYTVRQAAQGFEVAGFVQNLADGRVLVVAEGEQAEIDEFVSTIQERMTGYIRQTDRTDETGARRQTGFDIR